jgi:PIN domain nuclease of toxin-antitoxin system
MPRSNLKCLLTVIAIATASSIPAQAQDITPDREGTEMTGLQAHFQCNEMATVRMLTFDEAIACGHAFLKVKLSFLPGLGLGDYARLPVAERASANRLGYERYLAWSDANPDRVRALKAQARIAHGPATH